MANNPKKSAAAWVHEVAPAPVAPAHVEEPVAAAPAPAEEFVAAASAPVEQTVAMATNIAEAATPAHAVVPPELGKMFEAPVKSMTEAQAKVREFIEKGISQTRANLTKAKSAADEASSALEASFATAKSGVVEINVKALEALRASADANFDFAKSVLGVKSVSDYVTLHSEFARKQIETLTGQTKEFATLAQKVATESVEPIKAQVAKTFKVAV